MKTSLILGMTNSSGEDKQKSIPDVSNTATNAQLVAFGQGLVAITNNTYKDTTKVTKINCDTESKPVPSLKFQINQWDETQDKAVLKTYNTGNFPNPLSIDTRALTTVGSTPSVSINVLSNSATYQLIAQAQLPRIINITTTGSTAVALKAQSLNFTYDSINMTYSTGAEAATITGTIHLDGNDDYDAFNFPITIQIVPGGE